MITKTFIVEDSGDTVRNTTVQINGKDAQAAVHTFHVQLVPEDGHGSAIQLPSFEATEEHRAFFVAGRKVSVRFAEVEDENA